jgi:hypothetical protein
MTEKILKIFGSISQTLWCLRAQVLACGWAVRVYHLSKKEYVLFRTITLEALRMMPVRSGSKLLIRPRGLLLRLILINVIKFSAKHSSVAFYHYGGVIQPINTSKSSTYIRISTQQSW